MRVWHSQLSIVILDLYNRLLFLHQTRRGPSIAGLLSDTLDFGGILIDHQDLSALLLLRVLLLMTMIIYAVVCHYFRKYLVRLMQKVIGLPTSGLERLLIV